MTINKYKKTVIILIILITIFFGLNFVIARNSLNSDAAIPLNSFSESSYELTPLWDKYFNDSYVVSNAFVNASPEDDLKYTINSYKEKLDIFERKINYLTLAEKRIIEIENFGFKDSLLDKYLENINLFTRIEKDLSYVKLRNLIIGHQKRIDSYIYNQNDPLDINEKRQKKADAIFIPLIEKLSKNIIPYDSQKLVYSTSEILNKKDYGSYSIYSDGISGIESLDISGKQYLAPKPLSQINNTLFKELLNNSSTEQDINLLKSNSVVVIPINKDTKTISISYPTNNLISENWKLKTATNEGYFYTKKLDKPLKSLSKYYIKYYSRYGLLDSEKIGNKAMTLALVNDEISDIFIDSIIPNNLQKTFENVITTPDAETAALAKIKLEKIITTTAKVHADIVGETLRGPLLGGERGKPDEYSLTLFSSRELTKDELSNIGFEIYPYNDPSILLSKNEYLPWTNPINTEKPTPYFLYTAYFFSIIFIIYLLWDLIKKLLQFIWNLFSIFSKKTKIIFLLILAPSILFDIFMLPQVYDTITLWFTIFWIVVVVGYRLEGRFSYAVALSFLIICPVSLISKNEFIAEKAAIWTYMFLVVGTVQSLIELKMGSTDRVDLNECWRKTESLRRGFFAKLAVTMIPIKNKLLEFKNYLIYIFTKKRTLEESIIFFTKVFFIAIISIVLITFSIIALKKSFDYVRYEYRKYQRNLLNARIKKIEPYYVYKATKVLMRGDLFGLKNNEKQRLMSDVGEVEFQFWDDSKIIFVMPTEWSFGEHSIWIEKNIGWDGKRVTARSNVVKIKLIPIGAKMTPDDEKYFEQLKKLDKETLEINGY